MEKKKGNVGLVIFIIVLVVVVFGVLAFFIIDGQNTERIEKAMKKPALDYFEKYVSVNSMSSAYKVTLGMLKEANEENEDYNLKALEGCDDEKTYATITIDFATGKVKDTKITKKC